MFSTLRWRYVLICALMLGALNRCEADPRGAKTPEHQPGLIISTCTPAPSASPTSKPGTVSVPTCSPKRP